MKEKLFEKDQLLAVMYKIASKLSQDSRRSISECVEAYCTEKKIVLARGNGSWIVNGVPDWQYVKEEDADEVLVELFRELFTLKTLMPILVSNEALYQPFLEDEAYELYYTDLETESEE
jgi:hypothetical protein